MSKTPHPNQKAGSYSILRLNSVGLSLATVAQVLGCHPTSVTARLKRLGVPPADTRRTFMEDIFRTLTTDQQEWLADLLEARDIHVKELVRELLIQQFKTQTQGNP